RSSLLLLRRVFDRFGGNEIEYGESALLLRTCASCSSSDDNPASRSLALCSAVSTGREYAMPECPCDVCSSNGEDPSPRSRCSFRFFGVNLVPRLRVQLPLPPKESSFPMLLLSGSRKLLPSASLEDTGEVNGLQFFPLL